MLNAMCVFDNLIIPEKYNYYLQTIYEESERKSLKLSNFKMLNKVEIHTHI